MTYSFYIARCNDDSLYCGICKDLEQRETAHNAGTGAKYTRARRPVHIIYHEKYSSRSDALKREAQVKKWPKMKKEYLAQK